MKMKGYNVIFIIGKSLRKIQHTQKNSDKQNCGTRDGLNPVINVDNNINQATAKKSRKRRSQ